MKSREYRRFRILFVCEGNTCRSPMAEVALRAKVPQPLVRSVEIMSAGLSTFNGLPVTEDAEFAAEQKGYDLTGHRSRQISGSLVESSDLILCMEPAQARYLQERFPDSADRIHALRLFASGVDKPIEDPFMKGLLAYIKTLTEIDNELRRCRVKIWNMVRSQKADFPPISDS